MIADCRYVAVAHILEKVKMLIFAGISSGECTSDIISKRWCGGRHCCSKVQVHKGTLEDTLTQTHYWLFIFIFSNWTSFDCAAIGFTRRYVLLGTYSIQWVSQSVTNYLYVIVMPCNNDIRASHQTQVHM